MQSGSEHDRLVVLRDQRLVSMSFRVFGIRFAQPIDRRWHHLGKFIPLSQNLALPVRLTCNWTSVLSGSVLQGLMCEIGLFKLSVGFISAFSR